MKKLLLSIICLFSLLTVPVFADEIELPEVTDHEKVTIYIFRGNGCSYCKSALEYFNKVADNYSDYFEVKTYEVWSNQENNELLAAVAKERKDDIGGVPYIVVGDSYSKIGFMEEFGEEIIEVALEEYQNKKYVDLVAKVAKEYSDSSITTLVEAVSSEGIDTFGVSASESSNDTLVILGIFGAIVIGGAALVFFSRKK